MPRKTAAQSSALSRREQRRLAREARRRQRKLKTAAIAGGTMVLLALFAFLAIGYAANRPGEPVADMGNLHLEEGQRSPIAYNSSPPTSGPHYESIASWGVHTERIPDELMVHNLEDGGVGVWYDCPDGCPELVSQLGEVVERYHEGVLLAPYPGMDTRIALTAWTRIDKFDEFDQDRIIRFIRAFRGEDHHVASR
jgi:hypothetical protein